MTTTDQPIGSANRHGDLSSFLAQLGFTPPSKAKGVALSVVVEIANFLLRPVGKAWGDLNDQQQAKMAFLILNHQHALCEKMYQNQNRFRFGASAMATASAFMRCVNEEELEGKRLTAFVRNGGDTELNDDTGSYYQDFLAEHGEWQDAVTIFNDSDKFERITPFIRFQTIESMVSFLISAPTMILYYMRMATGKAEEQAIVSYGINVGRFMRNNLSPEYIFEMVFQGKVGDTKRTLDMLLQPCQRQGPKVGKLRVLDVFSSTMVFEMVKGALETTGPLLVDNFKTFPDFCEKKDQLVFGGDWNHLMVGHTEGPPHAFLITGVAKTDNDDIMGGVKFMVQDSFPGRPFIVVGWDLLKSMEVLEFSFIEKDVTFSGASMSMEHAFDNLPSITWSGSPAWNSAGIPDSITVDAKQSQLSNVESADLDEMENTKREKPDWLGLDISKEGLANLENVEMWT